MSVDIDIRVNRLLNEPMFDRWNVNELEKFVIFHLDNRHILKHFIRISKEMKQRGYQKSSGWAVIQIIRWDLSITTDTTEDYKISNKYIGMYTRLLMMLKPEFKGFFDIRGD